MAAFRGIRFYDLFLAISQTPCESRRWCYSRDSYLCAAYEMILTNKAELGQTCVLKELYYNHLYYYFGLSKLTYLNRYPQGVVEDGLLVEIALPLHKTC